jgi:ubiquinone/menaquinone biosynthesis C-methylase UbiE
MPQSAPGTAAGKPLAGRSRMVRKEIVKRQFDLQEQRFSSWSVTRNEEYMQRYFEFIGLQKGDTMLDVACGTGEFSLFCAKRIRCVHGIDISEGVIDLAIRQALASGMTNVSFECHDVEHIPRAENSFSVVQCRSALHHMGDYPRVFEEMVRCCMPGGRLALQDIMAYEDQKVNSFFEELEREVDVSHNAALNRREFIDLFDKNQAEIIRSFTVEIELNLREYLSHAHQSDGSLDRIGELLEEGLEDKDVSRFLYMDDCNETIFKRAVFLILGQKMDKSSLLERVCGPGKGSKIDSFDPLYDA